MRDIWCCLLLFVAAIQVPALAGDIPGLPTSTPPFVDHDLWLSFSNDFLGRGGSVDDFRTQQLIVAADIGQKWTALLDHSVLTLTDPLYEGRIDQLSGTLGYKFIEEIDEGTTNTLTAGIGFRSVGDFAGERIQNGFHRLIGSDIENLPYSDVDDTYLTAWIDAERYGLLHQAENGWRLGYWLRGRALATSDGQWDGSLSLMGVASKRDLDIWAGLRQDWRKGYGETVQRATAAAEEDLAFTIGIRFGSLVLETVQQFENDASFGQLRLLASESRAGRGRLPEPKIGLELGFQLPDVHIHLAARARSNLITGPGSSWSESIIVSLDAGEPQHEDNTSVFVESTQVGVGIEWARLLSERSDWLSGYGSVAAGWRSERLVGDGPLLGRQSESVKRGVLILGAGLRFHASALGERWRYRIQTGLTAWLPWRSAQLTLANSDFPVQEAGVALSLGVTFDFD